MIGAARMWAVRMWAARYWAKVGDVADPAGSAHTLEARASFDRRIDLYASVDDTITGRGAL